MSESKPDSDAIHEDGDEGPADRGLAAQQEEKSNSKSKRHRLKAARSRAKKKAKSLLGGASPAASDASTSDADDESDGDYAFAINTLKKDPAFKPSDPDGALGQSHSKPDPIDRVRDSARLVASSVAHPRQAVKNKAKRSAAGKLSSSAQSPAKTRRAELRFLEAEEASSRSGSSREGSQEGGSEEGERERLAERSRRLEEQRDSLRAAWITGRSRRVRVVHKQHFVFPKREDFRELEDDGNERFQWFRWIGNLLLYYSQDWTAQYVDDFEELPFDIDMVRNHLERLVIASGPWQTCFMDVRSIYRWEDSKRTGKYFALYLFLWYTNHVVGYLWAYIICIVVRNKIYPTPLRDLRTAAKRALDRQSAAFQLGELIDRHGSEDWLDPLIDEIGPFAQVQINDIANLMEVLYNFWAWKSPWKTAWSLTFFAVCLLVSLLTDMDFCLKIVWFVIGGSFFLLYPIACHYPRYRLLVSPMKWVLWDIPTHAEWSFSYLRSRAQTTREALIRQRVSASHASETTSPPLHTYTGRISRPHPAIRVNSSNQGHHSYSSSSSSSDDFLSAGSPASSSDDGPLSGTDIMSFRAHWDGLTGYLIVSHSCIRFQRSPRLLPTSSSKEIWQLPFLDLEEMWKLGGNGRSKAGRLVHGGLTASERLGFKVRDGRVWLLEMGRGRDEAFNAVLGFSGMRWQSLQTEVELERKVRRGRGEKGVQGVER